jgi:hypothetical protein
VLRGRFALAASGRIVRIVRIEAEFVERKRKNRGGLKMKTWARDVAKLAASERERARAHKIIGGVPGTTTADRVPAYYAAAPSPGLDGPLRTHRKAPITVSLVCQECGLCHDYNPQNGSGAQMADGGNWWSAIAKLEVLCHDCFRETRKSGTSA